MKPLLTGVLCLLFAFTKANAQINPDVLVNDLINKGLKLTDVNLNQADSVLQVADKIARKSENKRLIAKVNIERVRVLINLNEIDTAEILNTETMQICKSNNLNDLKIYCNNNTGNIYMAQGKYKDAIAVLVNVAQVFEKEKKWERYVNTTSNIAWCYSELMQYEVAKKHLRKCIYYQKQLNPNKLGALYEKMGIQFAQNNLYRDSSFYYLNLAEYYYKKNNDLAGLAYLLNNKAGIYFYNKQYKEAIDKYLLALESFKKIGVTGEEKYILNNLGISYKEIGNLELSEAYLNKSLQIAKLDADSNHIADLYKNYALLYESMGNFKLSNEYFKKHISLFFKNYSQQYQEQIVNLTRQNEIITRENEINKLKSEQALSSIKNTRNIVLASVLLILLMAIGRWYVRKVKRDKNALVINLKSEQMMAVKKSTEEERKRISRDLHDNIGSYAASIMHNVDQLDESIQDEKLKRNLDVIKSNASNVLASIRDTLTILNNSEISLKKIVDTFNSYANTALQGFSNMEFHFSDFIEDDQLLSAVDAVNLTYMLKELLNNSIKHSHASTIEFIAIENKDAYCFTIKDNGIGFDIDEIEMKNGMENLRYRSEKLEAALEIVSEINSGTMSKITIKRKMNV